MNAVLGLVMFGVALDLRPADFRRVLATPRPFIVGFAAQYLVLPAACFGLVRLLGVAPSLALGVLLVASCPGGNMSNFLTHLGRGNTALSISMTALSTATAPILTPLVFAWWGSRIPGASGLLNDIRLSPVEMVGALLLILGLPLAAGLFVSWRWPGFTGRAVVPFRRGSIVVFALFILGALAANAGPLFQSLPSIAGLIGLQNLIALGGGYLVAWAARLPEADRRAIGVEIGIRNAGLGLALTLTFFGGLGGMAVAVAWYGVWDLVTGMGLAQWWSRRPAWSS
jgi:BASS family bile acid:Na+ symporter